MESVEINKTLAPNMDGDGIGGSVNLKTKTAGELPTATLSMLGGRNSILGGRYNDQVDGTLGKRFGITKKLGTLIGLSYDRNGRGIDEIDPSIDPTSTPGHILYKSDTDREYKFYCTRWGTSGAVDYKFNDFNDIYVKGIYSGNQRLRLQMVLPASRLWQLEILYVPEEPGIFDRQLEPGRASLHEFLLDLLGSRRLTFFSDGLLPLETPKVDFSRIGPKLTRGYDPAAQTNPGHPHVRQQLRRPQLSAPQPEQLGFRRHHNLRWNFRAAQSPLGVRFVYEVVYDRGHRATFGSGRKDP